MPELENRTRKTNLELTKLDEEILEFSKQEVEYALEKGVRSQVQQFSLSYLSFDYANKASAAAMANYAQAEDAYRQGFISITQLLDAQSAKFNTRLLQLQTQYKMVLDYLLLERLSGKIQLLENQQAQLDYINQMQQFLLNKNNGR
jgi:outer membrane protein TolC